MIFQRRAKPRISRQEQLATKPLRLVEAEPADAGGGKWKLTVPLRPAKWARWMVRMPQGATKTFELDEIGVTVWAACDGKTSVAQLIRKLAKRYNLNPREAEVATLPFLNTLVRKGLIGMPVRRETSS